MSVKVHWTRQAREDLRQIRAFIARDTPLTAAAFVRRLRASVDRIRSFPEFGQVVPELGHHDIREILHGSYRIIYRSRTEGVDILTAYHSSRLLDDTQF